MSPNPLPAISQSLPTFSTLGNRALEPGITVTHYEFYTSITFFLHPGQSIIRKSGSNSETIKPIVIYNTPGGAVGGYKGIYDPLKRLSTFPIARGITKETHRDFIAWVFDNSNSNSTRDGMNAFLINHDAPSPSNGGRTSINLCLCFTTPYFRELSAKVPNGGFKPLPSLKMMSQKVRRIVRAVESQRDGVLQGKGCTLCGERTGAEGRECRKLRGRANCTWCGYFGRRCWVDGEGGGTDTESVEAKVDGDGREEDGGMAGRINRTPSRMMLSERKKLEVKVEVAGSRTLAGRVEKKPSSKSFDVRDFRYPRDEEDDCTVQSDDSALVHDHTPKKKSCALKVERSSTDGADEGP